MISKQGLSDLATDVRNINYGNSIKELVFNPETGDFEACTRGTSHGSGEIVTEMTEGGFAAEMAADSPSIRVILDAQEIETLKDRHSVVEGRAYEWEGENVVHIRAAPLRHSFGKESKAYFVKNGESIPEDSKYLVITDDGKTHVCRKREDGTSEQIPHEFIPSHEKLYSRNKGILEVDILREKRVLIVGLGSFGSQIAVELAKAGVGSFALMDFDRVELHNLARHIATVNDIGRLKTDVVEDAINGKNPYAVADKYPIDLNDDLELLREEVHKADIVVCATDNNRSRFALSKVLKEEGKAGIFGRAITRAEGGDVFRYRPGGPCYSCLIGKGFSDEEEISDLQAARREGRIPAYVSQEDAEAMVQVGLSSDILPICNLMVKLVLVELSKGKDSGISSLEDELSYDYYIWANRRDRHYANWQPFSAAGQGPTILKWYGVRVEKDQNCPLCSERINLESGEESIEGLEGIEPELL